MICRYWRGWTTPQNADAYQSVLTEQVIPMIESRRIPGFRRIDMMRRELGDEVEFATIMWFESIDAIKAFVGEDYEVAHVPEVARKVLKRWDERSAHYELFGQREQS
ncbi:antibiotic biosynthesis monooxygenase [Acidobacteria bacterium Mor1]|nr:antibiotic biosynthesis monooxygenase [Acidobacteria bacterium Mor1]